MLAMTRVLIIMMLLSYISGYAQDTVNVAPKLPDVAIKTLDGKMINASEFSNDGKPMVICFWKICCKTPGELLNGISEIYEDWVDETGVKLFAVSVDDSRSTNLVAPYVAGNGWEFEILLDPNQDLKRAMNVIALPHTFVLNGKGEIVWQKTSYMPGDEKIILEQIKKAL